MGHGVFPYLVDLHFIENLAGSGDESLYSDILSKCGEEIEYIQLEWESYYWGTGVTPPDDPPEIKTILKRIIHGTRPVHQVFVRPLFKEICSKWDQGLPDQSGFERYPHDSIDQALAAMNVPQPFLFYKLNTTWRPSSSLAWSDLKGVGAIPPDAARIIVGNLKELPEGWNPKRGLFGVLKKLPPREEVIESARVYISWIRAAAESGRALILFYDLAE